MSNESLETDEIDDPETTVMTSEPAATALLVQLVVDADSLDPASKFYRRCEDARALMRDLFEICEQRPIGKVAPLSLDDPSIVVLDECDIVRIEDWAHKYKRVILSIARIAAPSAIPVPTPKFAHNGKKKKKKKETFDGVPKTAFMLDDDDDVQPPTSLLDDED